MSDSDDADPRFRIPRGASDEDIDSDLASIASSQEAGPSSVPTASRATINAAADSLRVGHEHIKVPSKLPVDEDGEDADDEADERALSAVTFAATGRREISNAALKEARVVLPAVGKEGEGIVGGKERGAMQKEMMAKMLGVLGSGEGGVGSLGELKRKVARLSADGKKELSVPLADHVAGRIARGVAYDIVKEDVTEKWGEIIAANRKKKKLVFPLGGAGGVVGRSSGAVNELFKAGNEYEKEIEDLLKEAGVVHEKGVMKGEDIGLEEVKVTKEEVMERRREMAKVRSLMFHYEQKMKRIKKIKSRQYRRIMKREKEKIAVLDKGVMGDEEEEEENIRAEQRRVEERMTLRHKNTSKWVRRQLKRGEGNRNSDSRVAIEEQLYLHEQLKKRQNRLMEESEESDSDGSIDDDQAVEKLDQELEQLREEIEDADPANGRPKKNKPKKGLMSMQFMQVAEERKRKQAQELLEEMDKGRFGSDDDGENVADAKPLSRRVFSGRANQSKKPGKSKVKQLGKEPVADAPDAEVNFSLSEGEEEDGAPQNAFEEEDVKALKARVVQDYEDDEENGFVGMGAGEHGNPTEFLRGANQKKAGFTTTLNGRLNTDVNDEVIDTAKGRGKKKSKAVNKRNSLKKKKSKGSSLPEIKKVVGSGNGEEGKAEKMHGKSLVRDVSGRPENSKRQQPQPQVDEAMVASRKRKSNEGAMEVIDEMVNTAKGRGKKRSKAANNRSSLKQKSANWCALPEIKEVVESGNGEEGKVDKMRGKCSVGDVAGKAERSRRQQYQPQVDEAMITPRKAMSKVDAMEVKVMGAEEDTDENEETKKESRRQKKRRVQLAEEEKNKKGGKSGSGGKVEFRAEWTGGENEEAVGISERDMERMKFVGEAFAGSGGADEAEFALMKEAAIEKELPIAKDIGAEVLPGWGNWDGAGVKKRKRRNESAFAKAARERLAVARSNAISKRADRNMSHVILDEKRVKRAAELTLGSVPFPFKNVEQWQREVQTPVCRELVTGNAFSNGVKPRVEKKVGIGIEAIKHGELKDKKRRRKFHERMEKAKEEKMAKEVRKNMSRRGRTWGKRGVIDMRKLKAEKRSDARKGLMM